MHWHFTPYVLLMVIAVVVSARVAFVAWRRRPVPGATPFCFLMLAVSEWSLAYTIELISPDLATAVFLDNIAWLGAVCAPTLWLVFTLHYTDHARWLTRRVIPLLCIEPLITFLLVWTNPSHGLVASKIDVDTSGPFTELIFTYGVWYWINIVYSYALLLLSAFLIATLVQALFRSARLYREQAIALLIAVLAPWVGNALTIFNLSPFRHLDLTPFAFTVTGTALAWGLSRFRLLDIMPVAREAVIESMSDAVIVVDEHNRIVDLNMTAQRLAQCTASQAVGQLFTQVFTQWPELVKHYQEVSEAEIVLRSDETERYFDLHNSPLYHRNDHLTIAGRLIILNETTVHKQAERAVQESEERFRNIFAEAPIGMAVISLNGTLLQVNKTFCEMLGYHEQELVGDSLSFITHPEDVGKDGLLAAQALKGGLTSYKVEKRYLKKNRETLWADLTATVLRNQDGQAIYGLVMIENILERKRAKLLEEERHRVAYELHDGLAQVAASAHQHLQAFASHHRPRSPQARQELDRALELAQLSVKEARRLIAGLKPTALDDLGLAAALRLQIEAQRDDGWTITYDEALGSERLSPMIETTLFWIAQEALTNVRKHAGTKQVRLALKRQESSVRLEVQDWGCGFDPLAVNQEVRPGEHIGLREMQERVELVGGHFLVTSQSDAGTSIVAEIPLPTTDERDIFYEQWPTPPTKA